LDKQVTLQTIKNLKYFIFLKKINFELFSDVKLKLKYKINSNDFQKIQLRIFNPNNFKFRKYKINKFFNLDLDKIELLKKNKKKVVLKKISVLLDLFGFYAEFF